MTHYALLDRVKIKLRLKDADQSLSEELETYLSDVDAYINRKLRATLGFIDVHGNPVVLPLTEDTGIPVDEDLLNNATDLSVGKFRKEQNNEELLWNNAKENFSDYLIERFGWPEDSGQRVVNPTAIQATPTLVVLNDTITVAGQNFHQFKKLAFEFAGTEVDTTPSTVFADSVGKFSNVTFQVPDNLTEEKAFELKVQDGDRNEDNRAETFISVLLSKRLAFTVDARIQ